MSAAYEAQTAFHYQAYRPPIHQLILADCLGNSPRLQRALDIGCGAGHSSVALVPYCEEIWGLEPSEDMLQQAIAHPRVRYQMFDGKKLAFDQDSIDLLTFAGSLFYARSQELLDEVLRVSAPGASILVYDFKLELEPVLKSMGISRVPHDGSGYDYQVDFSGLSQGPLNKYAHWQKVYSFPLSRPQLSHLLLASRKLAAGFTEIYGPEGLFEAVLAQVKDIPAAIGQRLEAQSWVSAYRLGT